MFAVRSGNFPQKMLLATTIAMALLPTAGKAYTPEQEQACSGDAMRLCSAEIPDVDRITTCMIRNKSQLSPPCRVFFRPGSEEVGASAAKRPVSLDPPRKSTGHKTNQ